MWSAHKYAASPWQQSREYTGSNNTVWKQSTRTRNLSQDEEREGERRSWRELQLPVSIAMRCRAGAQRGRGSVRGWNGEKRRGGNSEREQRTGCTETSVYSEDERWRGSARMNGRFTADVEMWQGRWDPTWIPKTCHWRLPPSGAPGKCRRTCIMSGVSPWWQFKSPALQVYGQSRWINI